ncbi:hypothetical protein [Ancylomarina longa]|uniref:Uncharacterized protein n=1 Tax=Ancylomarina longa TaxID=2487017 RepID=A0A434AZ20_9BACT|nr:hypothetical protein [Ancylomarina longa]RUT79840.1 hypothetical protein DLK05_00345 [Ancylomarina longa]
MNITSLNIPAGILNGIKAIETKKIIEPTIPIGIYLQEAENLVLWSTDDLNELAKVGITLQHISELRTRIDICRKVQTQWIHYKETQSEIEKRYKSKLEQAKHVRREIHHAFTFAFRNDSQLQALLKKSKQSNSLAHIVQDLSDLHAIGEHNKDLLEKISFNFDLLNKTKNLSGKLGSLAADYHGSINQRKENKGFRDKTYTYLKHLVDEIRDAGKFVFKKDKNRLPGYLIGYYSKKKAILHKI